MFSVDFTPEGLGEVEAALAHHGLASKPQLSPEKANAHVVVVIVGGAASTAVRVEDIEVFAGESGGNYRVLGPPQASVTAATFVSKTPTVEDVTPKLREQAVRVGANVCSGR